MIFKVDFEKAFDSVRWDYLDDVLNKFGFGVKWRKWIQGCLSSSMGSILINGSPSKEFKFYKGLKQGDPLSPFLFILIMESLHISFNKVVQAGFYKGFHIDDSLTLSHLFYADDVVFVGKWGKQNVTIIVNVVNCFFLASGLKINLHKSKLMGIGIPQAEVCSAAESIGCSTLVSPFSFLGVKVGGLMSRRNSWDEVIIPYLYIKCPPSSPMGVLRILESIRWNFFNGVSNSSRKLVLIGWQKVLASKKNGGLGVLSFFAFNRALFFKWILRFISQDTSLWFRVIQAMYGKKGALDSLQDVTSRSSPWMDIIREFKWLSTKEVPLKLTYPRLFLLELDKNISIADNLRDTSLISSFRRMPRGGIEEDQVTRLRNSLDHVILSQSLDRWVWNLESSGDFSVK
ncbi:RNA-directed DNA polymerase, eukaryota [Tanacetum coccineum]